MTATLQERNAPIPCSSSVLKRMPARIKVLHIAGRQPMQARLAEAFAADSVTEVLLEEVVGQAAGLDRLHDEAFDAVLVSHLPGQLDALDLIEGYRAGGAEEPIIVLGELGESEMAALCYEVGADGYVCVATTTTRNLLWVIARAVQHHLLIHENQRLQQSEQTRVQREHDEAGRLLDDQQAIVRNRAETPDAATRDGESAVPPMPPELAVHYRELLRMHVIMGSGNLSAELQRLAELLLTAGFSVGQAVELHLRVVEELVRGLGARSTRHVMTRADLLLIELMMYLGEGYRRRFLEVAHPPVQRLLPGIE